MPKTTKSVTKKQFSVIQNQQMKTIAAANSNGCLGTTERDRDQNCLYTFYIQKIHTRYSIYEHEQDSHAWPLKWAIQWYNFVVWPLHTIRISIKSLPSQIVEASAMSKFKSHSNRGSKSNESWLDLSSFNFAFRCNFEFLGRSKSVRPSKSNE